ncbi:hypothetical protein [Nostoc sp.]|uniref:hypothetical protein n=1 Tax=Nostoc sp. TaxID=1180 RepID=UPI002FF85824
MSNILSDLSNLKELELQELSDEESQLVVGGNLFGSVVLLALLLVVISALKQD